MHSKRPHRWLLAALTTGIAATALASEKTDTTLQLRTARLEMPSLGVNATNERIATLAARPDQSYAVARLHAEVEAPQRAELAREGIELLSCLGPKTWIVSIDADLAAGEGRFADRIAWAGELPIQAKLHPDLAAGIVPEWTVDRRMLQAFERGEDIHRRTAAEVAGIDPGEVDDEQRARAKAVNFGIIYGSSAFGLANQLGIAQADAQATIDAYFARYQGVRRFLDETVENARGQLPLLAPMSAVAGNMAITMGAYHLARPAGGRLKLFLEAVTRTRRRRERNRESESALD